MPTLTVIAGPNGSGKSSLTRSVTFEGRERLLDPDAIARAMNPENPAAAAIAAGRETLRRTDEYIESGVSFAVETTLSSRSNVQLMRDAKKRGFEVRLIYVALNNPDRNIERVRNRVAKGGHFVPDEDVRRRYQRSLSNLPVALKAADFARVYDNSGFGHRLVLTTQNGVITWRSESAPEWVPCTEPS